MLLAASAKRPERAYAAGCLGALDVGEVAAQESLRARGYFTHPLLTLSSPPSPAFLCSATTTAHSSSLRRSSSSRDDRGAGRLRLVVIIVRRLSFEPKSRVAAECLSHCSQPPSVAFLHGPPSASWADQITA